MFSVEQLLYILVDSQFNQRPWKMIVNKRTNERTNANENSLSWKNLNADTKMDVKTVILSQKSENFEKFDEKNKETQKNWTKFSIF